MSCADRVFCTPIRARGIQTAASCRVRAEDPFPHWPNSLREMVVSAEPWPPALEGSPCRYRVRPDFPTGDMRTELARILNCDEIQIALVRPVDGNGPTCGHRCVRLQRDLVHIIAVWHSAVRHSFVPRKGCAVELSAERAWRGLHACRAAESPSVAVRSALRAQTRSSSAVWLLSVSAASEWRAERARHRRPGLGPRFDANVRPACALPTCLVLHPLRWGGKPGTEGGPGACLLEAERTVGRVRCGAASLLVAFRFLEDTRVDSSPYFLSDYSVLIVTDKVSLSAANRPNYKLQ